MPPINPYSFSDQLNNDSRLRTKLVKAYVSTLKKTLSDEEIIAEWETYIETDLREDFSQSGADVVVKAIAEEMPQLLEKEFDVDLSIFDD